MENGDYHHHFSDRRTLNPAILIIIGISTFIVIRILYVIHRSTKPLFNSPPGHLTTLIVLGSGGHTAEMLNLLGVMQMEKFQPRCYVAAATDNMSLEKARVLENSLLDKEDGEVVGTAQFSQIYRSREVGQSYITSVGTTLIALSHALWLMIKIRPQVILCNGPGTCIPLCVIAFCFKVLGIRWSSIFYVESIARVRRLSLSALLLYKLRMADQLFVQWPQLKTKYPRANYDNLTLDTMIGSEDNECFTFKGAELEDSNLCPLGHPNFVTYCTITRAYTRRLLYKTLT